MSKTMNAATETDNTTRQATTNKQAEILVKFTVVLLLGDVFVRRKSLETLNSLKLRYSNGGVDAKIKIILTTFPGIIMLFGETAYKVLQKMRIIILLLLLLFKILYTR